MNNSRRKRMIIVILYAVGVLSLIMQLRINEVIHDLYGKCTETGYYLVDLTYILTTRFRTLIINL